MCYNIYAYVEIKTSSNSYYGAIGLFNLNKNNANNCSALCCVLPKEQSCILQLLAAASCGSQMLLHSYLLQALVCRCV